MMKTKNYIKMCEKAEEIQALCSWEFGDRVATKVQLVPNAKYIPFIVGSNIYRVFLNIGYDMDKEVAKDLCIWLPTQEQLQEMIDAYTDYERANRFHEFIGLDAFEYGWNKWCEFINDASMNEIWLAFVMHEKYNKIWTGKEWRKAR